MTGMPHTPETSATRAAVIEHILDNFPGSYTQSDNTLSGDTHIFAPGVLYIVHANNSYGIHVTKIPTGVKDTAGFVKDTGTDTIDDEMVARIAASLAL